jgi:large subunit ribosomal protein L25
MAEGFDLIAEIREDQGKGASRRLRREGKVPAIIYGAGRPPRSLTFDHNKVLRQLENESFYSSVLNIKVGEKSQAAILKDLQRHPARNVIMHMDLQRIVEDEEIKMNVPLHFIGEDVAPGVKMDGGVVSHLMVDVEVTCLPKHLPEFIEVDVSNLGIDEMIHLSELKLPEGVVIPELAQGPEHDQGVVSIHKIKARPVEEDEVTEEAADDAAEASGDDEQPSED